MTRSFNLWLVLAAAALSGRVSAETLVSDAFGLYDPSTSARERSDWAGWAEGSAAQVIAPQEPDRLVIFTGPKSIVAGKDEGHVVAIVVDRFGNLVADGTSALVKAGAVPTATETTGGIADLLLSPRTKAENLFVGVTAGQRQSPQAMLSIVADIASIRPSLTAPLSDLPSDTAFDLRSTPLADPYDNPVPQGTGLSVVLQHSDGSYSLGQGLALQDSALIHFIARDIPGWASATMMLGAQSSDPVPLSIKSPAAAGFPALELERLSAIDALRVTLGPFLTTDGYALADGAQVTITADLLQGAQISDQAWVRDGEVSLMLPIGEPSAVARFSILSPLGPMDLTPDWHAATALLPAETEPSP